MAMKNIIILFLCLFSFSFCYGQQPLTKNTDPYKAQFITSDIPRFWAAFDSCKLSPQNSVDIYNRLYFDQGSYGLQLFKTTVIGTTDVFAAKIDKYKLYYESIRQNTQKASQLIPGMRKSFIRLKEIYPATVFPDIYLVMGCLSSGGRSMKEGLFLGMDVNSADSGSDFTNINPPFAKVLKSLTLSHMPVFIAHELVHYQQNYADTSKNVLSRAITEGSADFICKLVTGSTNSDLLLQYGEQHEKELWDQFKNDLYSTDIQKWFYYPATEQRPADLGYYIGFKITESYYLHSKDKKRAIAEILNIKDFKSFLKMSGYEEKFN